MVVVVIDVLGQGGFELTSVEDQQAVEALPTDRADEAFDEGVGPRGTDRCADDPDPLGAEDLVEAGCELGIPAVRAFPERRCVVEGLVGPRAVVVIDDEARTTSS